jgi:hypothetical protein
LIEPSLDDMLISNAIGLGRNQYVTPRFRQDAGGIMQMGILRDLTTPGDTEKEAFINELTHIWQSYNSPFR